MESIFEQKVEKDLKSMDQRLEDLEDKITSIDTKVTQVVDALLGNALTKVGGLVKDIDDLKDKITILELKLEKQEDFKNKVIWTIGIIVSIAFILQYLSNIYSNIQVSP